jgi:hypothetical protein
MPLNFGEAYAIVCPDGGVVLPDSKEYRDIMELMKQSGYMNFQDRLVKENVPVQPTRIDQVRQFTARDIVTPQPTKVSKKEWLSVQVNRDAFLAHLLKNK